jgi:hypothetical protein
MQIRLLIIITSLIAFISCSKKESKHRIAIDLAHKEVFWHDPEDMPGMDSAFVERMKYMTAEIKKTAAAVNADVVYLKREISPEDLKKCDLLFIHFPKAQYTPDELNAISGFVDDGGALFVVMDSDYWSKLTETNVNDIIAPYGIQFGEVSADTLVGATTNAGIVTTNALKIPYHEARIVNGGTPFSFSRETQIPFGMFVETKNGSRIVVMGEGMVSLYMTSWQGVTDYQSQQFMQDVFRWLYKM